MVRPAISSARRWIRGKRSTRSFSAAARLPIISVVADRICGMRSSTDRGVKAGARVRR